MKLYSQLLYFIGPVPCNLQTNLAYIDSSYFGNGYTAIYQVGVCINATYGDVCSDGITDDVALLFCRSQGAILMHVLL